MSVLGLNRADFRAIAAQLLENGHRVRFQASGSSMQPFIQDNDILEVAPLVGKRINYGDVLLVENEEGKLLVHRVVKTRYREGIPIYLIKGDTCTSPDGWFRVENILGRVEFVQRECQRINLISYSQRWKTRIWVAITPWVSKFSWLPEWFRLRIRNWLLVS